MIQNYYNKKLDKWNDEIIKNNIYKISKGKTVKSTEYYKMVNQENFYIYYNFLSLSLNERKILKIFLNARLFGLLGIDIDITIISYNKNYEYVEMPFKKEYGKKHYDGTTNFEIDVSKEDFNDYLSILITPEYYIIVNNAYAQFEEYFNSFDYISYKNDILNNLSK